MTPREVERRLKDDGWYRIKLTSGSGHRQYKHPTKPGKVTVPFHSKEVNKWTLKSIEEQSGVKM